MKKINIAREFSRFPAGRFQSDGPFSGERFREEFLLRALKNSNTVVIELDGVAGYGSSFLEEAFGGAVRGLALDPKEAGQRIQVKSEDASLVAEIQEYIEAAARHVSAS